jgi:cell wall-associated NlpC family hydrolase
MSTLDKRLHAYRDDMADVRLKGRVDAKRFVEGLAYHCIVPINGVHRAPAEDAMQLTQVLLGENVLVFDHHDGWAFVQLIDDGYVGYVAATALHEGHVAPGHKVSNILAHRFPKPDLKTQPAIVLPMHAKLNIAGHDGAYLALQTGGYVYASHVRAVTAPYAPDFVSVAEQFLHTPYLWGGKTALGLDCSGLVQVSLQAAGISCPRDSDMQEHGLGVDVTSAPRQRGDLVFWKGHVGIMQDAVTLLHANGHHLKVVSEPLDEAVVRIAAKGSEITAVKRLQ